MKIAFFSTASYDRPGFIRYQNHHQITFIEEPLSENTVGKAIGHQAVCAFAHDDLSEPVLRLLKMRGITVIAMRCVGLDNVDRRVAEELDLEIIRIPGYSPFSVAEHAVALLMSLVRHLPQAHERVTTGNFTLDGLIGNDLHGKTIGVIGTGHIGHAFLQIMKGFGCQMLANDLKPHPALINEGIKYVWLPELLAESDVVSLHCPLTSRTTRLIDSQALSIMKPTAILVNTSRGKIVDTKAVLDALDQRQLAGYAADVYDRESAWFHRDWSTQPIEDDDLNRLRSHPRALLTAHQGFLTQETLEQIASTLLLQLAFYENSQLPARVA
ncbi:2-hydroxyacid dehydrogenase [Larkinella rosea]|uniref:2-hydroxyacid dehydrogenase n=1 Tax=Larkinella rosea TaxID=2025312 RepID=A0A3P1BFX7_9BACT|nr:2-hydroxyacid dehydrogenase [Larkinella rosea]RRA99988.1 2-hydroxyacid dehydrogenase [Larkinella rosea]